MPWATFLLIHVAIFALAKLIGLTRRRGRVKFLGLTVAAGIFFVVELAAFLSYFITDPVVTNITAVVVEWGHITCLAFVLSALAVFIRESKPVFAQFPMLYTGLPLLIVLSYVLVKDTYALKNWLIAIYQGGAITVALLMYSVYTYRQKQYAIILSGSVAFLFSHLLYWYVPGVDGGYSWIWQVLLGIGVLTTVVGYEHADNAVISAQSEPTT